jgi:hypothetical protein
MSDFVAFKTYSSTIEAEMHAGILHEAGIPAIVQSPGHGMFGAGFSGLFVHGVTLLVPEDQLEDAGELIDDPEAE